MLLSAGKKMRRGSTGCKKNKNKQCVQKFHFLIKALSATLYKHTLCDWMIRKGQLGNTTQVGVGEGGGEGGAGDD